MVLLSISQFVWAETLVHVGVLAFRPPAEVQTQWQPLTAYLNEKIPGYRFEVKAMAYKDLEQAIAERSVDFVFTNPAHYTLMTYRNGLSSPLVSIVLEEGGIPLSRFGGVIISQMNRDDLNFLKDLKGRTVATVTQSSLGGYQAQAMELLDIGLEAESDYKLYETGMPHDRVVEAVLSGQAEVGFVRTGVLENMQLEGKLDLKKLKIIDLKTHDGFPLLHSSRLYPEWPFSAMPGIDEDLARKVTAVLLQIEHGGELARQASIYGFTIPIDYEMVRNTLYQLRLPPFDEARSFTVKDIWDQYSLMILSSGLLIFMIGILLIIVLLFNRKLIESRKLMQQSADQWQLLLTAIGEGVYGVDQNGLCTFINPAGLKMLGFEKAEIIAQDQHDLFHHSYKDGSHYHVSECPISMTLKDGMARNWEDWFWRKDQSGFPVSLTTAPIMKKHKPNGAVVVFRNISEQKAKENQLRKEAHTDPLTGIANRRQFLQMATIELERFQRSGEPASLIMIDLDHFKQVNDRYGHAVGDYVLQHFTQTTRGILRNTDHFGRIGGEEFAILLTLSNMSGVSHFVKRYQQLIAQTPALSEVGEIVYTVSMGLTEFDQRDEDFESILERADQALYQAKENGRNRYEICLHPDPKDDPVSPGLLQLKWKGYYVCGEAGIDAQHLELFRLTNLVLEAVVLEKHSLETIKPHFDGLISEVVNHFAHEEAQLKQHHYSGFEEHAAIHRNLLDKTKKLRLEFDKGQVSEMELIHFIVTELISGHMLSEDRIFYDVFKGPE